MLGLALATSVPPTSSHQSGDSDVQFRQLRHHTKNALQSILSIVDRAPELRAACHGASLSEHLQTRILLAAQLSDTLFGFTAQPGSFEQRMTALCEGVVRLLGERDAEISVSVSAPSCPPELENTVLHVANELVGNAVKHGMHARIVGRIAVSVCAKRGRVVLSVVDNGWGCGRSRWRSAKG